MIVVIVSALQSRQRRMLARSVPPLSTLLVHSLSDSGTTRTSIELQSLLKTALPKAPARKPLSYTSNSSPSRKSKGSLRAQASHGQYANLHLYGRSLCSCPLSRILTTSTGSPFNRSQSNLDLSQNEQTTFNTTARFSA